MSDKFPFTLIQSGKFKSCGTWKTKQTLSEVRA